MSADDEYTKGLKGIVTGSGWNMKGLADKEAAERRREQMTVYPVHIPDQPFYPVNFQVNNRTGIMDRMVGGLFEFGNWFVDHLSPLSASIRLAKWLIKVGWKVKLPLAILGALLCPALIVNNPGKPPVWPWAQVTLTDLAGHYAILVALALGVALGWVLPKITGFVICLAAFLIGLGIGLGLIALVVLIAYKVIDAIINRPLESRTSSPQTIEQPAHGTLPKDR